MIKRDDEAYCQPCVSPIWDTGACRPCAAGGRRPPAEDHASIAGAATGWPSARSSTSTATGPIDGPACGPAAGPSSTANDHYPDVDDTAVVGMALHRAERSALRRGHRPRRRMDRSACRADERRLGRLRRRQHAFLPQPHPVRRSRRAARSADRRTSRRAASAFLAQLGYKPRRSGGARAASPILRKRAGGRRLLVRPLGHQLHLRHLVGAVRAERRRRGHAERRYIRKAVDWLKCAPAARRRLGRGRRELLGRKARRVPRHSTAVADRLGGARR